jgi:ubiquinone/menaquinone biosynthesis C-methylase UbiE
MTDHRRMVYEVAQAIAPGWERQRARIEVGVAPIREWIVSQLAPRPGQAVLELAAGAGDTGFEAAAIIGEGGRLFSTDISPEMVDVARRRGAELKLRNVEYRVMDAEHIELEADSVDGVICRFGYMLMADPGAALAETRRVLRPGGCLALAVWGAPERNPWVTILAGTLIESGLTPAPEPGAPGPFSMASEERTRSLLEEAGFGTVRTQEATVRFAFSDVDDYLRFATDTAGPHAIVLRGLSDPQRDVVQAQLAQAFAPFVTNGGYELPGLALNAVAS